MRRWPLALAIVLGFAGWRMSRGCRRQGVQRTPAALGAVSLGQGLAARSHHMLTFLMIGVNTLARPAATLDLGPSRCDEVHRLIDRNPPGRKPDKKFRPIVAVTPTLLPWLQRDVGPSGRYVDYRRKPVRSILAMGSREMRKRHVPTE